MRISFCYFKDGKKKALTMSYDDGKKFDLQLLQIFNLHGIRGTFHLNSSNLGKGDFITPEDVRDRFAFHEIAGHTLTHLHLTGIPNEELILEVLEDRKNLEMLCGYPVKGLSYPYGAYSPEVMERLRGLGIKYSRTTKSTENFSLPDDFLAWHPTCHHDDPRLFELLEKFKSYKYRTMPVFCVWGHSYEFDKRNNWDRIERFCAEAGGDPDVWYATNIEIYDYFMALQALRFTVDRTVVHNPTATDVWIAADETPVRIAAGATVDLKML